MKSNLHHFSLFFILSDLSCLVYSSQTYIFENLHKGLRRNIIPNRRSNFLNLQYNDKEAFPQKLPETTMDPDILRSPYHNIYQGSRKTNDTRVFRRRFQYGAKEAGHHVYAQGEFNCILSHLAIETTCAIPVLLRGGTGHHYFAAVVRAKPGEELVGSVRAYCVKNQEDYYGDHTTPSVSHFMFK